MQIVWSAFAVKNLKQIFDYYAAKASKRVAQKVKNQILKSVKQLANHPESGQIELQLEHPDAEYRYLVIGNYKLIYRITGSQILVNDVFDTRQNPLKMNDQTGLNP